jgi:hypothetical protein
VQIGEEAQVPGHRGAGSGEHPCGQGLLALEVPVAGVAVGAVAGERPFDPGAAVGRRRREVDGARPAEDRRGHRDRGRDRRAAADALGGGVVVARGRLHRQDDPHDQGHEEGDDDDAHGARAALAPPSNVRRAHWVPTRSLVAHRRAAPV